MKNSLSGLDSPEKGILFFIDLIEMRINSINPC